MVRPRTNEYKLYYRTQTGSKKAVMEGQLRILLDENRKPWSISFIDCEGNHRVIGLAQDRMG